MAVKLQPVLVIGLGSTGLNVVEYLRQFFIEEFGSGGVPPVVEMIVFETVQDVVVGKGIRLVPLTIPEIDNVRYRMKNNSEHPKIKGYGEWLNTDRILGLGDSFKDGARGYRQAGRLILWENWDMVHTEIQMALGRCTSNAAILETQKMLERQSVSAADSGAPEVDGTKQQVYVVGTLMGGTCSGMFIDLGYMLRDLSKQATRVLTVTMLDDATAQPGKMAVAASNCYGALQELDFVMRKSEIESDAWSYKLPDGAKEAKPGDEPYNKVYVISPTNGINRLNETGLGQMVAMNMFLDIAGQGRISKDAAFTDVTGLRPFVTFGLGTVWYPKSKISGLSACELATELCDSWLVKSEAEQRTEAAKIAEADARKRIIEIEKQLRKEIDEAVVKAREQQKGGVVDLGAVVAAMARKKDAELAAVAERHGKGIKEEVRERLFTYLSNTSQTEDYWKAYRDLLEKYIDQAPNGWKPPQGAGKEEAIIRRRMDEVKGSWLLWLVGLRAEALRYYEDRLKEVSQGSVDESIAAYAKHRASCVLCLLRGLNSDMSYAKREFGITDDLGVFDSVSEIIYRVDRRIKDVRECIAGHRQTVGVGAESFKEKIETMGISEVVREQFKSGSLAADVGDCKNAVVNSNRTPGATTVGWHLIGDRKPSDVTDVSKFWDQEAREAAEILFDNYQEECLRHIEQQVADADDVGLRSLASSAKPYQEFNEAWNEAAQNIARSPDFIFAGTGRPRIDAIAKMLNFKADTNNCVNNGLKHMLFIYREARAFSVDMLRPWSTMRQHAVTSEHLYATHKNPDFFNWLRIENRQKARLLMVSARLLFPDDVFEKVGERYLFRCEVGGLPRNYAPDLPQDFLEMADCGAVDMLVATVNRTLRQLGQKGFEALFNRIYADLDLESKDAYQKDPDRAETIKEELGVLARFKDYAQKKIYGVSGH